MCAVIAKNAIFPPVVPGQVDDYMTLSQRFWDISDFELFHGVSSSEHIIPKYKIF